MLETAAKVEEGQELTFCHHRQACSPKGWQLKKQAAQSRKKKGCKNSVVSKERIIKLATLKLGPRLFRLPDNL